MLENNVFQYRRYRGFLFENWSIGYDGNNFCRCCLDFPLCKLLGAFLLCNTLREFCCFPKEEGIDTNICCMKKSTRERKGGFSHAKMTESPKKSVLFQRWKRSVSGMRNTDLRLEPNPFPSAVLYLSRFQLCHIPISRVKWQSQRIQPIPFLAIPVFVKHLNRAEQVGGWLDGFLAWLCKVKQMCSQAVSFLS